MSQIIQQLNVAVPNVQKVFQNAFMSGMHAMFWPLNVMAVVALYNLTNEK
jgi:hypothetical protein